MTSSFRALTFSTLALLVAGCGGENLMDPNNPNPSPGKVCQPGAQCCTAAELTCRGNPDGTMICNCYKEWVCEDVLNPVKCYQPADTPDGKAGWSCVAQNGMDVCSRAGTEVPSGKNGWACSLTAGGVKCERTMNTPNGGSGWGCVYSADLKFCSKVGPGQEVSVPKLDAGVPPPPPPPPKSDGGVKTDTGVPPTSWSCYKDALGNQICKSSGGLPPGGGDWKCYWKNNAITCEGSSAVPPGGSGWNCIPNVLVGGWHCTKVVQPGDVPPGGGTWSCVSSTANGGTQCTQAPPKGAGQECVPNQKMWCDGALYCGYGQVVCGPDGKWKTKANGELDCMELPGGQRPNTVCACYFFYFNQDCCETPDCIVPPGTNGQICPASKGGYCDYCNPQSPECTSAGAKCVVTPKAETYCGQDCTGGKPCPAGAMCTPVQVKGVTFFQCIPVDQSCYY